jgi:hypothetical protein
MAKKTAVQIPASNLVSKGKIVSTETTAVAEPRMRVNAVTAYGKTAEEIAAAIEAGQIRNVGPTDLTISAKVTKTKDETLVYEKLIALTYEGQAFLTGGKEEPALDLAEGAKDERTDEEKAKGACDHFNYGFDLEVKRILRGKLAELIEGPAKVIAKAAQNLIDNGIADDMETATAVVKAARAKKGLPV